jgi:hypothetical protein
MVRQLFVSHANPAWSQTSSQTVERVPGLGSKRYFNLGIHEIKISIYYYIIIASLQ